jgi:chorismate mutase
MKGLPEDRARIEEIDGEMLHLLNRRARIVAALHARKTAAGTPIYDAERTDAIVERLVDLNEGPLRGEQVRELFTFLLQHFALEHRPPAPPTTPVPPILVGTPADGAPLGPVARRIRRQGFDFLRVDAAAADEARPLCRELGLGLVIGDVVEAHAGAPATVLVLGSATDLGWIAQGGDAALGVADLRPSAGDPDARRAALLGSLAAGAHGALISIAADEDDEALADLAYRARRLCLALRAWPGATGDES